MKRYLWISISCFLIAAYGFTLTGCMTANQLAGEKAYYEAKVAMSQRATSQPIFEMTAGDPSQPIVLQNVSALRVFQLPAGGGNDNFNQYVQKDYAAPWVSLIGTTLSVAAPWVGVWAVTHEVANIAGSAGTTYNQTVSGTGNTAQTRTMGDMKVGDITGANMVGGLIDQTSTPTVVTQPAPVIVYAPDPIIVTQPAPVIVP